MPRRATAGTLAAALLALLAPVPAVAQAKAPLGLAAVAFSAGATRVFAPSAGGLPPRLVPFEPLGATISTGDDGHTTLLFTNGAALTCGPNASAEVLKFRQDPWDPQDEDAQYEPSRTTTVLKLERGAFALSQRQPRATSTLELLTPLGKLEVQAQNLYIDVSPDAVHLFVLDGSVRWVLPKASEHILGGQMCAVTRNSLHHPVPFAVATLRGEAAIAPYLEKAADARERVHFRVDRSGTITAQVLVPKDELRRRPFEDHRLR